MINIHEDTINRYLESIRPQDEAMRAQIDYDYTYERNIFVIYEVRPPFNQEITDKIRIPIAKIRYTNSQAIWKLYWMRGNGNWHAYEPFEYSTLKQVLEAIETDAHGCFFG